MRARAARWPSSDGIEPDRFRHVGDGAGILLPDPVVLGALGVEQIVRGGQADRLAMVGERGVEVPLHTVGAAAIVVEVGLGLALDGFAVIGDGAGVVARREIRQAAVVIGVRVLRNERDDLREVGNGPVVYAILEERLAAMTQRVRVVGIFPDRLATGDDDRIVVACLGAALRAIGGNRSRHTQEKPKTHATGLQHRQSLPLAIAGAERQRPAARQHSQAVGCKDRAIEAVPAEPASCSCARAKPVLLSEFGTAADPNSITRWRAEAIHHECGVNWRHTIPALPTHA